MSSFGDAQYHKIKQTYIKRGWRYQLSFYSRYVRIDEDRPIRVEVLSRHPFTKEDTALIFSTIKKAPPPANLVLMIYDRSSNILDIVWSDVR
ncbi:MAG: hypothetical protein QXI60_03155 [Thermofilaceae archaeon]